ncbi:hypothetical protein, partial [Proteus vulgaris]|uniref:hypothetical protein n=1 Tax=Proteus vulgaris TaxID=585 RepID=UPI00235DC5C3
IVTTAPIRNVIGLAHFACDIIIHNKLLYGGVSGALSFLIYVSKDIALTSSYIGGNGNTQILIKSA